MAGIGWRLERLIQRGVLEASAAYATGAAVMALPWVLTTAVLVSLPLVIGRDRADLAVASACVNAAYAVALLVGGPVQIVIARYAADRLYEGRRRAIAAPFCRALGTTLLCCAAAAACSLLALGLPLRAALWGAALSAAVGAQWTALAVGHGFCSPTLVLGAVGAGSALSFALAIALVAGAGLGVPGYLFGLLSGQVLALVILLSGILRTLPEHVDERARLLPAFRDFAALGCAGFAFNASLWADKLVAWTLLGGPPAALHASASSLAWFSTIPCLAWIFVEVETRFHRRCRAFYRSLEHGASLDELRRGVGALQGEVARLLRGGASVQAGVTAFLELAAEPWARGLGLPPDAVLPFRLLLLGAGAQALGLLGLIVLYHFDLRRQACLAAVGLLAGISGAAAAAAMFGLPPSVGTALGCSAGAALTWRHVFRGIEALVPHTLLVQPYAVEPRRRTRPSREAHGGALAPARGLAVSRTVAGRRPGAVRPALATVDGLHVAMRGLAARPHAARPPARPPAGDGR